MKSRVVRLAMFLLVVLAFGTAAYVYTTLERQAVALGDADRAFDEQLRSVDYEIGQLRSAHFAYVAVGQGSDFWTARAATLLAAIPSDLKKLQNLTTSDDAKAHISAALDACSSIEQIDRTVRSYLREDSRLLASDLVFSNLRQADATVAEQVALARSVHVAAGQQARQAPRRTQLATAAGAALFALLVLVLLAPGGARAASRKSEIGIEEPQATGRVDSAAADGVQLPAPGEAIVPPAEQASLDLASAAALCTDFARLGETSELTPLLERTATLLDLAGIIVWIDDRTNGELRPALAQGYAQPALARIHAISKDADNATACAFREGKLQVVAGDAFSDGALAVPLMTPAGCVGVMATEVRRGREHAADVQAVATILGAQIATLFAAAGE